MGWLSLGDTLLRGIKSHNRKFLVILNVQLLLPKTAQIIITLEDLINSSSSKQKFILTIFFCFTAPICNNTERISTVENIDYKMHIAYFNAHKWYKMFGLNSDLKPLTHRYKI